MDYFSTYFLEQAINKITKP